MMKKLVRGYVSPCTLSVVVEEGNLKGNAAVTPALIDLIFTSAPKLESVTLINSDLRKVGLQEISQNTLLAQEGSEALDGPL